jgi:eukaryotic-like serine/threonine-protein kinase
MPAQLITLGDRYTLESEIARGGMATVFKAHDEVLARRVAVKVLHENLSRDDAFLERFRREALSAARLTHPNIVAIYDTGADRGDDGVERHFIVMEYCGRGTLADLLATGSLAPDRVTMIGGVVCEALSYAHDHGIVHRDVKPANVLIAEDGTLKVADFGIAKAAFAGSDLTTTGAVLGTVTYISPEQAKGLEPDARSDLYSIGVVLYELLTGRPPFEGETQVMTAMQHLREEPPPPRSIRGGIPRGLEDVILTALAKDPDDRFASAREMKNALAELDDGGSTRVMAPVAESPTPSRPASTGLDLRWGWTLLAIAAVAALIAFTVQNLIGGGESGSDDGNGGQASGGGRGGSALDVQEVIDFDPHGTGGEHGEDAHLAADGDKSTAWETETYNDPLEAQGKPGVGLVFDLGESAEVDRVEISGAVGSFELRAGSESGADETSFKVITEGDAIDGSVEVDARGSSGRYWLVWITALPGGTGRASISEVVFFAS